MAKKNFYAVRVGITPGIYKTWDECSKNTSKFPGAVFKGFESYEEAEAFMAGLGFSDFRVRLLNNGDAKLELRESQLPLLFEKKKEIVMELKKYYNRVLLDLEMRNE